FPGLGDRMSELEEQLEIVHGIFGDGASAHQGRGYTLAELDAQPKPLQRPGPPLVMGGGARPRAARMAARYAAEYNLLSAAAAGVAGPRRRLREACRAAGRAPGSLGLSVMLLTLIGRDRADVQARTERFESRGGTIGESALVGTVDEVAEQLRRY